MLSKEKAMGKHSVLIPKAGAIWYGVGICFGIFGILVALVFDRGVGKRTVKATKGCIAVVIIVFAVTFSGEGLDEFFGELGRFFRELGNVFRQQRNFEALCANPDLTCIKTNKGWDFQGSPSLIAQICKTENTGIVCETSTR